MKTFRKYFFWSTLVQIVLLAVGLLMIPYWLIGWTLIVMLHIDRVLPDGILAVIVMFALPIFIVSAAVSMIAATVVSRKSKLR